MSSSSKPDASGLPSDHLNHPEQWATGDEPATDKQKAFIAVLEKQKGESVDDKDELGKSAASEVIDALKSTGHVPDEFKAGGTSSSKEGESESERKDDKASKKEEGESEEKKDGEEKEDDEEDLKRKRDEDKGDKQDEAADKEDEEKEEEKKDGEDEEPASKKAKTTDEAPSQPSSSSNGGAPVDGLPSDHLDHPDAWATGSEPATSKQLGYLAVLEKQKGVEASGGSLDKAEASEKIAELQAK